MSKGDDPLGKGALFSTPHNTSDEQADKGESEVDDKHALYSADTDPEQGTIVIRCSSCLESTRVTWGNAALRTLWFTLWVPGKRFSRYMICPACHRRAWCKIRWTTIT